MTKRLRAPSDINGVWAIIPTPATPDAGDWRATDTVDLDETARIVELLIEGGVSGILSMGTLGECATLTWPEKQKFMAALVESARGRVPVFVGTTASNTRDTVEQSRYAYDLGADGTMLGLPHWCAISLPNAVQFYRDVAEGTPDLNIAIYANVEAFKFDFPTPFWAQVADIPQVVTAKYSGPATLMQDLAAIRGQIKLLPNEYNYYGCARMDDRIDSFWSSGAVCGPNVAIHLHDLVAEARRTGDWSEAQAFAGRLGPSGAALFPEGSFKIFSTYNIALEKARMEAGGLIKPGPVRPPYRVTPEPYLAGARRSGEMWAEISRSLIADGQSVAAE
ncbi:MAG: dihydrodipicolinate synthase family protein [Novosphingobium sp.]|nr:dihydrodipicolinate synthase family protein [Novosphingobium sp.]